MSKFNIGDKVESLITGDIYTITSVAYSTIVLEKGPTHISLPTPLDSNQWKAVSSNKVVVSPDWREAYPVGSTGWDSWRNSKYEVVEHLHHAPYKEIGVQYPGSEDTYAFSEEAAFRYLAPYKDAYDRDIHEYEPRPKASTCRQHEWKNYVGLSETFIYCEHCDIKK